jgi:hypothetical protein
LFLSRYLLFYQLWQLLPMEPQMEFMPMPMPMLILQFSSLGQFTMLRSLAQHLSLPLPQPLPLPQFLLLLLLRDPLEHLFSLVAPQLHL